MRLADLAAVAHLHNGRIVKFDLPTLLAITVFSSALAGGLLLLSWLQHRRIFALALWGSAFLIAAIGTALIIARGTVADFWSIVIGNAILAAAYGMIWSGVRNFEGKRVSVVLSLTGAAVWLAVCAIGPIYAVPTARAVVMAAIAITYALLAVVELWRSPGQEVSRWPIMLLLLGHAAAIPVRIPLAGSIVDPHPFHVNLVIFVIFETLFLCICAAYLFGGLAKERIATRYQHAALIDSLTGVANRRGFLQSGERLMVRTRFAQQPAALLLFDIDRFKSINDRYGHGAGDAVLKAFCQLATSLLRPTDLFGRIGGEEFAGLLPDADWQDALDLAERLRSAFEATTHQVAERPLTATVSVGVAISDDASSDLASLLDAADQALYRAKAMGRNRVEFSMHPVSMRLRKPRAVLFSAANSR